MINLMCNSIKVKLLKYLINFFKIKQKQNNTSTSDLTFIPLKDNFTKNKEFFKFIFLLVT